MNRGLVLLPAAGVLVLLGGCTSSSGGGRSSAAKRAPLDTATVSPSSSSSPPSSSVVPATSVPASVPNATGVITGKYVALTSCKATAGGWQAHGTARSATGKAATYTVTVFFTTDRATVQAYGQTTVNVAKGKTAKWTVTKAFEASPSTLCVLRGAG